MLKYLWVGVILPLVAGTACAGDQWPSSEELIRRAGNGPSLILSEERLQQVKGKVSSDPLAKDWWRRFRATCERFVTDAWDIPDRGGQWQAWYSCRKCGSGLETKSPVLHVCRRCGEAHSGFPYDDVPLTYRHLKATQRIRDFGLAYLISGDVRFAEKAKEGLMKYAEIYPSFPLHNKGGVIGDPANKNREKPAKTMCEVLWECEWCDPAILGFDAIRGALSAEERTRIENNLLRPFVDVALSENARIHNHQCWHLAGFGLAALVLRDAKLLEFAINGKYGLRAQMREGILEDGSWFEGAWGYHFYVLKALNPFVIALSNLGCEPDPRYKAMFLAPFGKVSSSWQLPSVHDSARIEFRPGQMPKHYELANAWWDEPVFSWWVSKSERSTEYYALYGRVTEPNACQGLEWRSEPFPGTGFGVLRSSSARNGKDGIPDNYIGVDYGRHGGWHGHFDKLSIVLYGHGKLLAEDPGNIDYGNPKQFGWFRTTLAHNTLSVDGKNQMCADGRLIAFASLTNGAAIAMDAGKVAEGVRVRRAIALDGDIVYDFVWAKSDCEHDWCWNFHSRGNFAIDGKGRKLDYPRPKQPYRNGRPIDSDGSDAWGWVREPEERTHTGMWNAKWDENGTELNVFQRSGEGTLRTAIGETTPMPNEFRLVSNRTRGRVAAFATVMTLDGSRDVRIDEPFVDSDRCCGFVATVNGVTRRFFVRFENEERGEIVLK